MSEQKSFEELFGEKYGKEAQEMLEEQIKTGKLSKKDIFAIIAKTNPDLKVHTIGKLENGNYQCELK